MRFNKQTKIQNLQQALDYNISSQFYYKASITFWTISSREWQRNRAETV